MIDMSSIHELFNKLCSDLSVSGEVSISSERFAGLMTNLERVKFAAEYLEKFGLWPRVSAGCLRSDELSVRYREDGNRAFKGKRDGEALEMYTKSIAFAKSGSEAMGLAFANRSAVLFERKLYRECLEVRDGTEMVHFMI